MAKLYTITELTREFDTTTRTLRFYEAEGMLNPERRGRTRLYPPRERTRLKLILRGKRLGFTLAEIREIIGLYDTAPGEAGQLAYFLKKIRQRLMELEQKRIDIDATLGELQAVERRCRERLSELGRTHAPV